MLDSTNGGFASSVMRQVLVEGDSVTWVGTYGDGLYKREGARWQKIGSPFRGSHIFSLIQDKDRGVWIGTSNEGAFHYRNGVWNHLDSAQSGLYNTVWSIFIDRGYNVYFCSRYRGVYTVKDNAVVSFDSIHSLKSRRVMTMAQDSKGRLWLGTEDRGVIRFAEGESPEVTYINTESGLSGNHIRSILCDSTIRWVGSWDGGVDMFSKNRWIHDTTVKRPVVFLTKDRAGRVWAATWGHGIYYMEDGSWRHITSTNSGLPDNYVIQIAFGSEGSCYFVTSKGVARWGLRSLRLSK